VTDIPSLQRVLRQWQAENADAVKQLGMIIGFGCDPATMAERRHPTAAELDEVSRDLPVYLMHQSGHFGAANSLALQRAGFTAQTADPPGGIIRRLPDGSPHGVLEETAHFRALGALMAGLGDEGFAEFARAGARIWTRYGYTTAQEGRADTNSVGVLRRVAAQGGFDIDIVAYPDVLLDRDFIAANVSDQYVNGVRVGGAKLTIDGSPQGFTAWRDRPYFNPVGDYPPGYAGYPCGHRGAGQRRDRLGLQAPHPDPHARQRRARVGRVAQRHPGRAEAAWPWPTAGALPRAVPARGSGRQPEGTGRVPVAVPDAHLLLGRLAPRAHGGARGGR